MFAHLRANLWLLFWTLLLCCGVYPLTLWAIGRTPLLRPQAEGSMMPDGVGSRLIAQPFNGDEYFQPRPSATAGSPYNAMASGGSNLAASNPKLRGRVAQQLGTIVRYQSPDGPGKGALVGIDIEKWFQMENDLTKGTKRRDLTAEWAMKNPSLIARWATSDPVSDYVKDWAKEHTGVFKAWKAKNPGTSDEPKSEELAPFFFDNAIADSFVKVHPGMWPCIAEVEKDGKKVKVIKPAREGDDVRSIFFDLWLQEHKDAKLEPVPADMVMASGSGLDPHITLKNARYQLPRVAGKWAANTGLQETTLRKAIDDLLLEQAAAPFGGFAGVPLVNILEVNLALSERVKRSAR